MRNINYGDLKFALPAIAIQNDIERAYLYERSENMFEHLTDIDAINLMLDYYGKKYPARYTAEMVAILSRAGVVGLVQYVFEQGVQNERESK